MRKSGSARELQLQSLFERIDRSNPALERALLFNATHNAGCVGKKMADFRQGMHHCSLSSVWFTAQPVAAALTTRLFIATCIWYTSYYLMQTSHCFAYVLQPNHHHFQHYRFTALELRGDGTSSCPVPTTAAISAFGVSLDHCPVEGLWSPILLQAGPHALLSFNQSVSMNKWWFRTRTDAGTEADPVRFKLAGCGGGHIGRNTTLRGVETEEEKCNITDDSAWQLLSSSAWIARPCSPPLMVDGRFATRLERGASETFELRPGLPQLLELVALVLLTVANAMLVCFGWVGSQRHSRRLLMSAWFSSAVLFGLSGGWLTSHGDTTLILGAALLFCVQFAWMFLFERHLASYFCGIGTLRILYGFLCVSHIRRSGGTATTFSMHHLVGLSQVFLGVWVLVSRWRVVRAARALVAADSALYGRLWQSVQQHPAFEPAHQVELSSQAQAWLPLPRVLCQRAAPPSKRAHPALLSAALALTRSPRGERGRAASGSAPRARQALRAALEPFREAGDRAPPRQREQTQPIRDSEAGAGGAREERMEGWVEGQRESKGAGAGWWFQMGSSALLRAMAGPSAVFKLRPGPGDEQQGGGELVTCIDRVLLQAAVLVPELSKKVVCWSVQSGGCFVDRSSHRILPWSEALADPPLTIASVKRPERAIEKVLRLYRDDVSCPTMIQSAEATATSCAVLTFHLVSLLTDVCRASIVFEDLARLHQCVCAILADPDCQVVRAKNRYSTEYDAEHTAGYRDVALNLVISTKQTREHGVAGHICELQLLLRPFAETKSQQGHARYVVFRNALGT